MAFFIALTIYLITVFCQSLFVTALPSGSIFSSPQHVRGHPSSTPRGFSDQSAYVGLKSSGALLAVGDFNRDRFVDLLMLDANSLRAASVQFWDHDAFRFVHRGRGINIANTKLRLISSASVADFNNDGILDVLLSDEEHGVVYFGDGAGNFNLTAPLEIPLLPPTSAVVDANADLSPEIFVAFANGTRGFWLFEKKSSVNVTAKFKKWDFGYGKKLCNVVDPVSISFVDLDGDCHADLVIPTDCGLEVWSNQAASSRAFWELAQRPSNGSIPAANDMRLFGKEVFNVAQGDGSIAFADFDSDGTLDIAVPNSKRRDLTVFLNQQYKRHEGMLCSRDPDFKFVRKIGLKSGLHVQPQRVGHLFSRIDIPASIHIGDYDLDGFPDIVAVDAGISRPVLFQNIGRWKEDSPDTRHAQFPHFERIEKTDEAGLWPGGDALTASFFDTDESGRQDIMVVRRGNDTRLVWNNFQKEADSLFFKSTVLSGLSYRGNPHPFAPVAGNTVKVSYIARGRSGKMRRICTQCGQSGHWLIRPCYCVVGLSHIANYVEELAVGAGKYTKSWTNLMPNSMAVVWAEKGDGNSSWRMDYFTQRRGGQMLRVVGVLVVALMGLGVAYAVLSHQEKKQDREDLNLERQRLFHFGGT